MLLMGFDVGVMVECTVFKIGGSSSAPTSECVNKHEHRDSRANRRRGSVRRDDRVERRRDGYGGSRVRWGAQHGRIIADNRTK